MIRIEAIIKPERVTHVTSALLDAGCKGFFYHNVTGQGRQGGVEVFVGRGGQMASRSSVPKTIITTIIADEMQEKIVDAIINAARNPNGGEIGDGKIFISPISDAIRVSDGQKGGDAI